MNIIKNRNFFFITIIFIFCFFNIVSVFAISCKYTWEIDKCMKAQYTWNQKSIEDFVCINSDDRWKITYQIILDKEFKKIDKKMDKYLENLEKNKNIYFWVWAQKNYIDWINDIHDMWDKFRDQYLNLCTSSILESAISCSEGNTNDDKKVEIANAIGYFKDDWTSCSKLVNKKISIYEDVAFWVLMLNKQQIKADEKKTYDQWERSNYDHLLDIMMINIWYIERIWQKVPSLLANPYH